MLFLVWTNSSNFNCNTQTLVMSDSETNSKVLQNHQHVPSNHNTDQSKTLRTQCTGFCFKNKTQLTLSRKMTQIKKRKNGRPVLENLNYLVRFFPHQV